MTGEILFQFGLLLAAIILFATNRVRPDAVASEITLRECDRLDPS